MKTVSKIMKINSKKLMIALLAVTGLLLLALLIYGGFSLGRQGAGESSSDDDSRSGSVSGVDAPINTGTGGDVTAIPDTPGTASINQTVADTTDAKTYLPPCSGRVEHPTDSLISLIIDWETISRSADMATVRVSIKISSYALFVSERSGCKLTFLGQTYAYSAPEINYDGTTRAEFTIHEQTVSMPLVGGCGSAEISTVWLFRGEYAGVQIDELALDGFIEIKD